MQHTIMKPYRTVWEVSPEDHSRGRGGFNGEWFDSPGITDVTFDSLEEARDALERRFKRRGWNWSEWIENTYTAPNGRKHLRIFSREKRSAG